MLNFVIVLIKGNKNNVVVMRSNFEVLSNARLNVNAYAKKIYGRVQILLIVRKKSIGPSIMYYAFETLIFVLIHFSEY
jgi:hypothetical protein